MYLENKDAVQVLVRSGTTIKAALVILGLSTLDQRRYMKGHDRQRFMERNRPIGIIDTWKCPECGGKVKHVECLGCKMQGRVR